MINKQIGENIRKYRTLQKISMQRLGDLIHKSKAAIFKYEKGDTAIDMETLLEIAKALNIEVIQLISNVDGITRKTDDDEALIDAIDGYYYYQYNGVPRGLIRGRFEVMSKGDITLYYGCNSKVDFDSASIIYWGNGSINGHILNLQLCNQKHHIETISCIARLPLTKNGLITGFVTGLSPSTYTPIINKFIMSKNPITNTEALIDALTINKEEIASVKKMNTLPLSIEKDFLY